MVSLLIPYLQSAEDFAECINKLTDDKQHHISKEMIRKLFSIGIENDISRSVFVQKVHRPYVSKEIAELFACPEVIFSITTRFSSTDGTFT